VWLVHFSACTAPPPIPIAVSVAQVHTNFGRGGRAVAASVSSTNRNLAIAATESGGLFRTTDGGATWKHLDSFPPFRVQDIAFASAIASNPRVVVATTAGNAHLRGPSRRGIWLSADDGDSWSQAVVPVACSLYGDAHGIAFAGANWIFVATDCGILASPNMGAVWSGISPFAAVAVAAQIMGSSVTLDACTSGGHRRSTDGGAHWSSAHAGPACQSPHGIAVSPLEGNVLFATSGPTLLESDDGGMTWTDLHASAFNERPVWVATQSRDRSHFTLYFPGRRAVCAGPSATSRCADGPTWDFVPALAPVSAPNHDINAIALDPRGSCPVFMAADAGVFLRGAPTAKSLCGDDATWTVPGSDTNGLNALQIYDVTGAAHQQASGASGPVPAFTNLFVGTQDNLIWATHDVTRAAFPAWQGIGVEGSFLQAPAMLPAVPASGDEQVTFMDFGFRPARAKKSFFDPASNQWLVDSDSRATWTSADPPGDLTAPFLVGPNMFVQWNAGNLFLSLDGGATWTLVAELPGDTADPSQSLQLNKFGSKLTKTPTGPALFEYVVDPGGRTGLALQTTLAPPRVPNRMDLRTFAGRNNLGQNSGLQSIGGNCFGSGAWHCRPVYAADPGNFLNVIVADTQQRSMMISHDAGLTWSPMNVLTELVTQGGALSFQDELGASQVHVIAYDPANPLHILVGTDETGIFGSANGGATWFPLLNTVQITGTSSMFFDANTGVVYVGTYGRGLWRLIIDWSLFPQ